MQSKNLFDLKSKVSFRELLQSLTKQAQKSMIYENSKYRHLFHRFGVPNRKSSVYGKRSGMIPNFYHRYRSALMQGEITIYEARKDLFAGTNEIFRLWIAQNVG